MHQARDLIIYLSSFVVEPSTQIIFYPLHVSDYVNAEIMAQGLCGFAPNQAAFEAGRIMLTRLYQLAKEGANFAFETTLAILKTIRFSVLWRPVTGEIETF